MNTQPETVLITGAAGHLGQAVAQYFQAQGFHLVLLDHDGPRLERAYGVANPHVLLAADLLDREQLGFALDLALKDLPPVSTLCHIAGGFRMGEAVHETSSKTWDFLFDLNARSLVNIASLIVPKLLALGRGKIVTVGAGAALRGGAQMGAYAASKSALLRLTESMSAELKAHHINVNAVLPSIIDTPDNRAAMPDANPADWVSPAALAAVIGFLASDAARAVHGAAIPVSGLVS